MDVDSTSRVGSICSITVGWIVHPLRGRLCVLTKGFRNVSVVKWSKGPSAGCHIHGECHGDFVQLLLLLLWSAESSYRPISTFFQKQKLNQQYGCVCTGSFPVTSESGCKSRTVTPLQDVIPFHKEQFCTSGWFSVSIEFITNHDMTNEPLVLVLVLVVWYETFPPSTLYWP